MAIKKITRYNTGQRAMLSNSFVMRLCGRTFQVSLRAHMIDALQNLLLAHFCWLLMVPKPIVELHTF